MDARPLRTRLAAGMASVLFFVFLLACLLWGGFELIQVPAGYDPHDAEGGVSVPFGVIWSFLTWTAVRAAKAAYCRMLGDQQPIEGRFTVVWAGLFVFVALVGWIGFFEESLHFKIHIRQSREGALRRSLAEVRDALGAYASDHKGAFPPDLAALTIDAKYLPQLRRAWAPDYHSDSDAVALGSKSDDAGGWLYDPASGSVRVNCTHTDSKGTSWTSY